MAALALPPLPTRPQRSGPGPSPVPGRTASPLEPNAELVERDDLSPSIARFVVRPDAPAPAFAPGQYFALGLPVDGRWLLRPYSTATAPAPGADRLEFLIRLVPNGALTPRLWAIRPGARLRIGPPKGLFSPVPDDGRSQLLVATGTGLAPFLSFVRAGRSGAAAGRAIVVHGAARTDELAYRAELERAVATGVVAAYVPAISRPADPANAGWRGRTGRLDGVVAELAAEGGFAPASTVGYLCGNPAMIDAVAANLRTAGLADDAIIREHYWIAPGA